MKTRLAHALALPLMAIAISMVVAAAPASAATYLKQVTHTDPMEMMGRTTPAQTTTSEIWIDGEKAFMSAGSGQATILRGDRGLIYMVDFGQKTYLELPLSDLGDFGKMFDSEEGAMDDEDAEAASDFMRSMLGSVEISVTPTTETKKIGQWNATKYLTETKTPMGTSRTETWASEDVEVDYSLFYKMANAMQLQVAGAGDLNAEMEKIKGYPVLMITESEMMGNTIRSRTELVESSQKPAPDGIFDIPGGFQKQEIPGPGGHGMGRK